MIRHIVNWRARGDDDATREENARKIVQLLLPLRSLPEVASLEVGVDLLGGQNWDVGLVVDFTSREEFETYRTNPDHLQVFPLLEECAGERSVVDILI